MKYSKILHKGDIIWHAAFLKGNLSIYVLYTECFIKNYNFFETFVDPLKAYWTEKYVFFIFMIMWKRVAETLLQITRIKFFNQSKMRKAVSAPFN